MLQTQPKNKKKIILLQRVRNLGKRGDVVFVAPGYFRNFLTNGFAVTYDDKKYQDVQKTLKSAYNEQYEHEALSIKDKLENKYLLFERQASGTGVLFASVSTRDIANEIKKCFGIEINFKKVVLKDAIKKIGIYEILVDLSENIEITMFISVGLSMEEARKLVEEKKENTNV